LTDLNSRICWICEFFVVFSSQRCCLLPLQVTLVDEQFLLEDKSSVTSAADLCTESRTTAQRLLSHYVRMQGLAISQAC